MNTLKRIWIRLTNKPAYGALLEMDRLCFEIAKRKRLKRKYSHIEKQLFDVRVRYENLIKNGGNK